jgi:UDP-N-acetyl-D-mannosaminuronic acid dehydrogenase
VLVERLRELGAEVIIHDPYVPGYQGDLAKMTRGCDVAGLMVAHDVYRSMDLEQLELVKPVLVDGRHVFDVAQVQAAGFVDRGVGQS